jgi:hypothetical protein
MEQGARNAAVENFGKLRNDSEGSLPSHARTFPRCYNSDRPGQWPHGVTASFIESEPACLSSPLSYPASSTIRVIFIHALGCEVTELMSNTSEERFKIPEHTGREINSPGPQAGKGKLVRMKGLTHFQEFLVFENDNRQPFIGIRGVSKVIG